MGKVFALWGRSCAADPMALQILWAPSFLTGTEGTVTRDMGGLLVGSMSSCSTSHLTHCALADCSITKFLNRILGLEVDKQNMLFQYFSDTFDYLIEKDKKEGKYDMGILGMEKEGWSQLWGSSSSLCSVPSQHRS